MYWLLVVAVLLMFYYRLSGAVAVRHVGPWLAARMRIPPSVTVALLGTAAGLDRLGLHALVLVQDAVRPAARGPFDRVLVDAPCSGIGSARRRPERSMSTPQTLRPMERAAFLSAWREKKLRGIFITAVATSASMTVTLWSTSRGYEVDFTTSDPYNFRSPPTKFEDDPTLPKGKEVVEEAGSSGFDVTVSRTVTKGGAVVRRDSFVSNYSPWVRVVRRGTKDAPEPGAGSA